MVDPFWQRPLLARPMVLTSSVFLMTTLLVALPGQHAASADTAAPLSFNRAIRPILSDKCFRCHGPDEQNRAADLRLDQRSAAIADRGGYAVIVPGDAEQSELVARITSDDPDLRMPPPDSNLQLTPSEIEALRAWIGQGAPYEGHWSFQPLVLPPLPRLADGQQIANPIDAFVAAKLQKHGLALADEADPDTLLRRVTLDLTGLPPTLEELAAFRDELARPGADAAACYERVVDRLLQSPHFGEHMAVAWLDAARYADTNGYFGDKPRQMWLWRDWVIDALNANMPFDQFTIEQIAGDLLPNATTSQRIATGFNRNHMANNETGIIDEEFRVEYVADRVHTTMTTWLAMTAGCAQCHDHKYDPISQREFYELFALFNNVPESGLITVDNPPPLLEVPSDEQKQQVAQLANERRLAVEAFQPISAELKTVISQWEPQALGMLPHPPDNALVLHEPFDGKLGPTTIAHGTPLPFEKGIRDQSAKFDATRHAEVSLDEFSADEPWSIGFWFLPEGSLSCPVSLIEPDGDRRGIEVLYGKKTLTVHLVNRWGPSLIKVATIDPLAPWNWHHIIISYDGSQSAIGLRVYVNGSLARLDIERDALTGSLATDEPLRIGRRDEGFGCYGQIDELRILQANVDEQTASNWFWSERIRGILSLPPADRSGRDEETLLDYYIDRFADDSVRTARQRMKSAIAAEQQLRAAIPTVLVMEEMEQPRTTHVLERGEYDKPGAVVEPGVPAAIAPWPGNEPRNRLGFARWLVSPTNPLTARVAVNRLWQQCFGQGLVRTAADFGSQGELPTHPELLDWLAATFRDEGWDVKRTIRLIVTSRTYKQRSDFILRGTEVVDPENRLLARGPSYRLSAEMLRDQALAISGLLVPDIGGPSVKPYQPPGLWEEVSYNGEDAYVPDTGAGQWRRSLYTYIKRQAPPPFLLIFDGPTREKCSVQRNPTNTPLQALVLLNDPTFLAAARALADQAMKAFDTDEARLEHLWTRVLLRAPRADERQLMLGLLERQRKRFAEQPESAREVCGEPAEHQVAETASENGRRESSPSPDISQRAAWTVVAHTILNLDEAITRR